MNSGRPSLKEIAQLLRQAEQAFKQAAFAKRDLEKAVGTSIKQDFANKAMESSALAMHEAKKTIDAAEASLKESHPLDEDYKTLKYQIIIASNLGMQAANVRKSVKKLSDSTEKEIPDEARNLERLEKEFSQKSIENPETLKPNEAPPGVSPVSQPAQSQPNPSAPLANIQSFTEEDAKNAINNILNSIKPEYVSNYPLLGKPNKNLRNQFAELLSQYRILNPNDGGGNLIELNKKLIHLIQLKDTYLNLKLDAINAGQKQEIRKLSALSRELKKLNPKLKRGKKKRLARAKTQPGIPAGIPTISRHAMPKELISPAGNPKISEKDKTDILRNLDQAMRFVEEKKRILSGKKESNEHRILEDDITLLLIQLRSIKNQILSKEIDTKTDINEVYRTAIFANEQRAKTIDLIDEFKRMKAQENKNAPNLIDAYLAAIDHRLEDLKSYREKLLDMFLENPTQEIANRNEEVDSAISLHERLRIQLNKDEKLRQDILSEDDSVSKDAIENNIKKVFEAYENIYDQPELIKKYLHVIEDRLADLDKEERALAEGQTANDSNPELIQLRKKIDDRKTEYRNFYTTLMTDEPLRLNAAQQYQVIAAQFEREAGESAKRDLAVKTDILEYQGKRTPIEYGHYFQSITEIIGQLTQQLDALRAAPPADDSLRLSGQVLKAQLAMQGLHGELLNDTNHSALKDKKYSSNNAVTSALNDIRKEANEALSAGAEYLKKQNPDRPSIDYQPHFKNIDDLSEAIHSRLSALENDATPPQEATDKNRQFHESLSEKYQALRALDNELRNDSQIPNTANKKYPSGEAIHARIESFKNETSPILLATNTYLGERAAQPPRLLAEQWADYITANVDPRLSYQIRTLEDMIEQLSGDPDAEKQANAFLDQLDALKNQEQALFDQLYDDNGQPISDAAFNNEINSACSDFNHSYRDLSRTVDQWIEKEKLELATPNAEFKRAKDKTHNMRYKKLTDEKLHVVHNLLHRYEKLLPYLERQAAEAPHSRAISAADVAKLQIEATKLGVKLKRYRTDLATDRKKYGLSRDQAKNQKARIDDMLKRLNNSLEILDSKDVKKLNPLEVVHRSDSVERIKITMMAGETQDAAAERLRQGIEAIKTKYESLIGNNLIPGGSLGSQQDGPNVKTTPVLTPGDSLEASVRVSKFSNTYAITVHRERDNQYVADSFFVGPPLKRAFLPRLFGKADPDILIWADKLVKDFIDARPLKDKGSAIVIKGKYSKDQTKEIIYACVANGVRYINETKHDIPKPTISAVHEFEHNKLKSAKGKTSEEANLTGKAFLPVKQYHLKQEEREELENIKNPGSPRKGGRTD